jgi:ferrochelatase
VLYDLDVEALQLCDSLGLSMTRAKTVGVHPKFIGMIRELILERINPGSERRALGSMGARADVCAEDCCPAPQQRPGQGKAGSSTPLPVPLGNRKLRSE